MSREKELSMSAFSAENKGVKLLGFDWLGNGK
jgi:hypothetical protein